jgi:hypothetical protein
MEQRKVKPNGAVKMTKIGADGSIDKTRVGPGGHVKSTHVDPNGEVTRTRDGQPVGGGSKGMSMGGSGGTSITMQSMSMSCKTFC